MKDQPSTARRASPDTADRPLTANRLAIGIVAVTVILTAIAFFPALQGKFLNWDDEENVVFCTEIRHPDLQTVPWLFTNFIVGDFKPAVWVSYMVDYAVWGPDPFGYHLVNLLLHAAATALLGLVILKLWMAGGGRADSASLLSAGFAALLFGVHPLRVEAVAWISARKDVLCAVFYLSALFTHLEYARSGKSAWYHLTLALAALALLSKPIAVTLPIVLLLCDVYPLGRISLGPRLGGPKSAAAHPATAEAKRAIAEKLPIFAFTGVVVVFAFYGQAQGGALISLDHFGLTARIGLALKALAFYLYKTAIPLKLAAAYPAPAMMPMSTPIILAALALFTLLGLIGVVLWRKGNGWPILCWTWYMVALLPVIGLFRAGSAPIADRFTYFPGMALSMALFLILRPFLGPREKDLAAIPAAAVLCLVWLSFGQSAVWRNSEALWTDAARKYPNSALAHAHSGEVLYGQGRHTEAIPHLRAALALIDAEPSPVGDIRFAARTNLARALAASGQTQEAEAIFLDVIRTRDPWFVHHSLARLYQQTNRAAEAAEHFQVVLQRDPTFVPALCEYGLILAQAGQADQAIALYLRALKVAPRSPRARYNLALAFMDKGNMRDALRILRELSLEYEGNARLARAITVALEAAGKKEEAEAFKRHAAGRVNPSAQHVPYTTGQRRGIMFPLTAPAGPAP